jgi:predicted NAD-dependent protein-ADP-ribosyltransferase YbiA (DUF1768 family)
MENIITFTKVKLPFGWMGNMSPYPINYMDKTWRTTEALFQALRFNDEEIQEAIRNEPSPMGCKMKMKTIVKQLTKNGELHKRIIEPLSKEDLENMELCVRLKIEQHDIIKEQLLKTAGYTIYEDVTKRGKKGSNLFWGALKKEDGTWEGENHLGKIWMKIREEIIDSYRYFSDKEKIALKAYKYGLAEDPYKELKEAYENGLDIAVLHADTMKWYVHDNVTWDKPIKCYRIKE